MVKTDAQLVAQVRLGDLESFGTLVERYERTLLAVALGVLRDFHRAEDVVQATLLLAFRRLSTLQDDEKFGAWVIQIARTQALEAARSRSVPATVSLGPEHELGSDGVGTNGWIEFEQVLSLVAQLPDPDRALIGLRYFDGHSMSEIASLVGRPLGTITKQLSRAIVRLRSCWEKENR
jgi:RNA polymerase sigma-70 factor (ECF subfamily)